MATTLPAMKARLGDTDYYILSMKAGGIGEQSQNPKRDGRLGRCVH